MPLDGTTLAAVVHELQVLIGGRIDKITQPEPDEILLSVRNKGANYKLLLTANANAPRLNLTTRNKISPLQAPMFTMVLRKHLSGGRITSITQPDFERIVEIELDAMDEMGDLSKKTLLIEIMGKHSNIILLDKKATPSLSEGSVAGVSPAERRGLGQSPIDEKRVLDAIKHVPLSVSSVRPVLPGSIYTRPIGKLSPLNLNKTEFFEKISLIKIQQAIYQSYNGFSPIFASEVCNRAGLDPTTFGNQLSENDSERLYKVFEDVMNQTKLGKFNCQIYFDDLKAVDLVAHPLTLYAHYRAEEYDSPSKMLETFYSHRDEAYRISQKTADLRKLVTTHQERCRKKTFMYDKTLEEIKDRDTLRIKGELLTSYMHMVERGANKFTAQNYYDGTEIEISIDATLSPSENAQKYFKKYNKQKRAFTALQEQIATNQEDLAYLDSVAVAMEHVTDEADIAEIRAELAEQGFAKKRTNSKNNKNKKASKQAKPLHYTSSDGYDMYVGKKNTQNDYLTLRFASPRDIWLHTKDIPGSHVIIVTQGKELPESTILEAANLAALHSKAKNSSQVPVDYVARKHVRKPNGAKPGFVIYDYHKTVYVTPKEVKV